jgi:hypothetical protein
MFETAIVTIPIDFSSYLKLIHDTNMKQDLMNRMKKVGSGYALTLINEFGKTTRTWSWSVDFHHDVQINGDGINIQVYTYDEIYGFVNNGTSVRYATMSDDFISKTLPWHIGSGAGAGRMLFVNKEVPRPGIDARHFDDAIHDQNEGMVVMGMERAMDAAIGKIFGGW